MDPSQLSLPVRDPMYRLSAALRHPGEAVASVSGAAQQCGGSLYNLARSTMSRIWTAVGEKWAQMRCPPRRRQAQGDGDQSCSGSLYQSLVDPNEHSEGAGGLNLLPEDLEAQVVQAANDANVQAEALRNEAASLRSRARGGDPDHPVERDYDFPPSSSSEGGCGCCTLFFRLIIGSLKIWFLLKVFSTIMETSVGGFQRNYSVRPTGNHGGTHAHNFGPALSLQQTYYPVRACTRVNLIICFTQHFVEESVFSCEMNGSGVVRRSKWWMILT